MALSKCNVCTNSIQKETTLYGSVDFPIAIYEDNMAKISVPVHWHDEFEFIIATKGSITVLLNGTRIELLPGEAVFINSGCLHSVESVTDKTSVLKSLTILPKFIGGSAENIIYQKGIAPLYTNLASSYILLNASVTWQSDIISCMQAAWTVIYNESYDFENESRYHIAKALHILSDHLANTNTSHKLDSTAPVRVKKMITYIQEHYSEDISNQDLMSLVSCSESVLLRNFKQITGTSPMQFLISYRISKASELLLSTNDKTDVIAKACGFHDTSYFTKTFRKIIGITPVQYKKYHI